MPSPGVKAIFSDKALAEETGPRKNVVLSSANSINWGRLVPQIVYYFSAYADLLAREKIELGDKMNIVVPTGNFWQYPCCLVCPGDGSADQQADLRLQ